MAKIQYNQQQFTVTIPSESIRRMGWEKGTEVYISKHPDRNVLYIEEMPDEKSRKKG